MDNLNYFTHLFQSKSDYKKIVLLMFLIKNDVNFLHEYGYLKGALTFYKKKLKTFYLN